MWLWVNCRHDDPCEREKTWRAHRGSNVSLPGWMPRSHRLSEIYTLVLSLNSWKAPTAWEKLMASHQDTRYQRWRHPFIHGLSLGWPNRRRRVCEKKNLKKAFVLIEPNSDTPAAASSSSSSSSSSSRRLWHYKRQPFHHSELTHLCCHSSGMALSFLPLIPASSVWIHSVGAVRFPLSLVINSK